eukprot:403367000
MTTQTLTCCKNTSHQFTTLDLEKIDKDMHKKLTDLKILTIVCDEHQDFFAKYWCSTCERNVCIKCATSIHIKHEGLKQIPNQLNFYSDYIKDIIPRVDSLLEMLQCKRSKIVSLQNHDILKDSEYQECSDFLHQIAFLELSQPQTLKTPKTCDFSQQTPEEYSTPSWRNQRLEFKVVQIDIITSKFTQETISSTAPLQLQIDQEETKESQLIQQQIDTKILSMAKKQLSVYLKKQKFADRLQTSLHQSLQLYLQFIHAQEKTTQELIEVNLDLNHQDNDINEQTLDLIQMIEQVQGTSSGTITDIQNVPELLPEAQNEISFSRTVLQIQQPRYTEFQRIVDIEVQKQEGSLFGSHLQNYQNAQFRLIYQGSRDGFTTEQLQDRLKLQTSNHSMTFLLSNHGQVFGGYSTVKRTFPDYEVNILDQEAFIFQLNNRKVLKVNLENVHKILAVTHQRDLLCCFGSWMISIESGCNLDSRKCCARLDQCYQFPEELKPQVVRINPGSDCKDEQLFNLDHVGENQETIRNRRSYLAGAENFIVDEIEIYEIIYELQQI